MSASPQKPSLSLDTSPIDIANGESSLPAPIPEVVVNGKKRNSSSLDLRPTKSSLSSNGAGEDGWGSNFWVTLVDPQTGTSFYACPATGQVSWDPPVGNFVLPPSEEGEWWELADDSRGGLPYYYQTKTGETVWERPEAFVIPLGILQNTSLARRLSARFSIGTKLDGDFPPTNGRPNYRRSRSHTTDRDPNYTTTRLEDKRKSGSSTRSSPGKIAPSNSSPQSTASKKSNQGLRKSFSTDPHHSVSKRSPNLPTIPGSDVSDTPGSPRRKSSSASHGKKETPPKRSDTPTNSGSQSASSRSRSKGSITHRSPPPQSLNAAVHKLASPAEISPPADALGFRPSSSSSSKLFHSPDSKKLIIDAGNKHSSSLSGHKKSVTIVPPPSPKRPIPAMPVTPTRSTSFPQTSLRGKGISSPVMNSEATSNLSPIKTRAVGKPIPIHKASNPSLARPSTGGIPILPQDLASDIQQFVESDFAKQYFSTHRTGFIFRRTVPVEQLMTWQKAPLASPLLLVNRNLHKNAVKVFKVIQRLMGDKEEERTGGVVRKGAMLEEERWLLSEALTHGELRDEIYCQVMKQLVGNPSSESVFKGWQLLCVCLVTFPPSKNFETYLQSFMRQRITQSEGRVDVMAKYCLRRLAYISKKGPRGKPPSPWEIEMASDAAFNPSIFGESLDVIYRLQQRTYPQQKVPIILPFLADGILALGGTKAEGIFRVPGDSEGVSELKLRIDKGHYNLEGVEDPYILASLMKLWLRELCDPLVPEEMYNDCVASSNDPAVCVQLVQRLPTINRRVVLFVVSFLQLFLDDKIQGVTKMTAANLALVMTPNLLRCDSDSMAVVFNNAQYEQTFVHNLLMHLKCNEMDPDYTPSHGLGAIAINSSSQPRHSKSRTRRPG